jgi:arsenate reductase
MSPGSTGTLASRTQRKVLYPTAPAHAGQGFATESNCVSKYTGVPHLAERFHKLSTSLGRPESMSRTIAAVLVLATSCISLAETNVKKTEFFPSVQRYVEGRIKEFKSIPEERKAALKKVAQFVKSKVDAKQPAKLTFICTHNSRRSHLSQIWAAAAAQHYGIAGVETFSGGTEATAFNPRAIAAVERAGLEVKNAKPGKNPQYEVRFGETEHPLICFSKVYSEQPNPTADFCAVMTCSQADKSCPNVSGAAARVAIPYQDPKSSDGTPEEQMKYDACCEQISREMLYLFSQVHSETTR